MKNFDKMFNFGLVGGVVILAIISALASLAFMGAVIWLIIEAVQYLQSH